MKNSWLIGILFFCSWSAIGQNTPAFRQFYFNPYLYNPAFAGTNDYAEVSLFYRQQWLGFNNAPSVTGFTLQYPSYNRVSLAMNFITQEAVALRTTSTQATFAYRIPITAKQFIFFGISGIVGYNDLNLNDADYSNDPAILNAASTKVYGDANFGLVYQLSNLRIGFSLPNLFGQPYFAPQDLVNVRYAQFRNQLYSASYKINAGNFSFEPYALYRTNRDLQNWWEAATIVYFKEKLWTGASYNSTQGLGFFLGMDFKEKLRFGYSYELPPANGEYITTSSHEIHLKLRLGKKRIFRWAARFDESQKPMAEGVRPGKEELIVEEKLTPLASQEPPKETEVVVAQVTEKKEIVQPKVEIVKQETIKTESKPVDPSSMSKGLYIIMGSFHSLDNARVQQKRLLALGYKGVKWGINPTNKLYYVYLFYSTNLEECRQKLQPIRLKEPTKSAWILRIQ
jgi:type IX secretion system PorP/SprF family membrane protein